MEDYILDKFFEQDRWEYALDKGLDKEINRKDIMELASPFERLKIYRAMKEGRYEIFPPHTAKIPKENKGDYRIVYANEPKHRVVLSIANDLLFELTPELIHPSCKSYQKGVSCGLVAKEVSKCVVNSHEGTIGFKSDLSKYFDSVPLKFIDGAFDYVEKKYGHSALIDVLRKYYHCDLYFDEDNQLQEKYQSLKQGCSVASWLANVLLYHIDDKLSKLKGRYWRYSDDMLFIGDQHEFAMEILSKELAKMDMKLNPKKVESLSADKRFVFLGYSILGSNISLSRKHVKNFQHEIESRTIKKEGITMADAVKSVMRYLYVGDGEHSWADQVLNVCNVTEDIQELNKFAMDCIRAVETKRTKLGGLGYTPFGSKCVLRGIGRNVKSNREKIPFIDGFVTLNCAQHNMNTCRAVYETLIKSKVA